MLKTLGLIGSLIFIGCGIVTGQGYLIRFARSIKLGDETILDIILRALQTPYLYLAGVIYAAAVLSYLYVSRLYSFSTLNISLTGLIIVITLCADYMLFKQTPNWAQIAGASFMLIGVGFMVFAGRNSGAI